MKTPVILPAMLALALTISVVPAAAGQPNMIVFYTDDHGHADRDELQPPGLAAGAMAKTWHDYFDFYLEGKPAPPLRENFSSSEQGSFHTQGWLSRNATLTAKEDAWHVTADPTGKARNPFLANSGLKLTGPVKASIAFQSAKSGQLALSWRLDGETDFSEGSRVAIDVAGGPDWQTHALELPASGTVIQVRLHLPGVPMMIRSLELHGAAGATRRINVSSEGLPEIDSIELYQTDGKPVMLGK